MTILFLTRLFYPHIGGVEKHVMEISKRLVARGHKVVIITEELPEVSLTKKETQKNGIEIHRIPVISEGKSKKFRIWLWLFKNRCLIKKSDVIHCHDVFFWYLPFRFLYPRKPAFTTFHGYESYPVSRKAIIVRKISEKLSFGNICVGDFIKKWYGTNPTFVSYGGVNVKTNRPPLLLGEGRGEVWSKDDVAKYSALFIGRLDDQTGILTYNETFKKLRKKYPKFEFLAVGDGPCKELLDKNAKKIGFQKNPEKYFKDYHFAFVSRYLSILEAMAAKRLVFAVYDNPVKEDYLKMAPFAKFIIIEDNAKDLSYQVQKIINNPKIEKKMIESAYEWTKKQTWEEMTKKYITLWNKN